MKVWEGERMPEALPRCAPHTGSAGVTLPGAGGIVVTQWGVFISLLLCIFTHVHTLTLPAHPYPAPSEETA